MPAFAGHTTVRDTLASYGSHQVENVISLAQDDVPTQTREFLPFLVDSMSWVLDTASWLHPFMGDFLATTRCSAPAIAHPYSRPRGISTCGFSVSIAIAGSHVPLNRLMASSGHLSCRMPLRP